MKYKIIPYAILIPAVLVGCVKHNNYFEESKTTKPISMPAGVRVEERESYYPVPDNTAPTTTTTPSQEPPGSHLERFKQSSNEGLSAPSWVINQPVKTAWTQVGGALHRSTYTVLDQDRSLGSYYILDTPSTHHKITQNTPIYRILLKSHGKETQMILLNQHNEPVNDEVANRILADVKKQFVK